MDKKGVGDMKEEVRVAFERSIPVLFGYLALGATYGVLLSQAGYGILWAFFTSLLVYGGSMQFVLISFLNSDLSYISIFITALSVSSRHIFYGLSFVDIFKHMGWKYPYMVYTLTDETYPLLLETNYKENLDIKQIRFLIALFDHSYWIIGGLIGNTIGSLLTFNSNGMDFVMTALFVVILVNQLSGNSSKLPAIIGAGSAICMLVLLGADHFFLPALLLCVVLLCVCRKYIEKGEQ